MTAQTPALRLVSTKGMPREEWLRVRQSGIGSSDCAAAIGISPYKSQLELWAEKTGKVTGPDLSEKEAIYFGSLLEPLVANEYAKRSGNKVRRVNSILQHPEYPFMLANLDREIVGATEGPGILEVKTAGYMAARQWEEGVPWWYEAQVMHQLAVTNRQWADLAVLIGGQEYRCYRLQRDDRLIEKVIKLESEFWADVVEGRQPVADGTESSARALAALYPRDAGASLDLTEDADLNGVYSRLVDARNAKKEAEAAEEKARQRLQERMGEATTAAFVGGKVTWKLTKDGVALDLERLKKEHGDLLKAFELPKPGVRRFTVQTI